jgi:iron complex transport system substrate-binding protein
MRIVSLQPSISLTLAHLGRLDSLVACTKYCLDVVPELRERNLPGIADSLLVISDSWTAKTEEILAAEPDIVIASVPYRMESLANILKSSVPVLTLAPSSLADIDMDTRVLAGLVHAVEAGEALIEKMNSGITFVRERLAGSVDAGMPAPLVYCEEWGNPLIHSQEWVAELVTIAGGKFLGTPGAHTTAEEIAATDPDAMLFAWCGAGDRVPLERVIEKRGWQDLRAVRSGRVFCIPDELLNTPAITLLDGLMCIAAALHPAVFTTPAHMRRAQ